MLSVVYHMPNVYVMRHISGESTNLNRHALHKCTVHNTVHVVIKIVSVSLTALVSFFVKFSMVSTLTMRKEIMWFAVV